MQDMLLLDKQVGETPLECIERFKRDHPEYGQVKMTYAGRLDPIASGLLVVLAGDKVHEKERFLKLSKTYECTALLGIATDTYDVLGLPTPQSLAEPRDSSQPHPASQSLGHPLLQGEGPYGSSSILNNLCSFIGTFRQPYPPYSSKTIGGKHMHALARAGELDDVEIPSQEVTVESIVDVTEREISLREISREIAQTISLVHGDFRQATITAAWGHLALTHGDQKMTLLSFTITVSSGTYIRGIVHELGQRLGIGACITRLYRKSVGPWVLDK